MSCGGFRPGGTTDTSPPIYRWVHQPPLTLRPGGTFEMVHGEKETTALNMGIGWIYLHVSSRCGIHGVTILFLFLSSSLGTHL